MPVNPMSLQPHLPPVDPAGDVPKRELAEEDFLSLMMAQMQNQDPMNPMDSANFMDQVTSMNTVKQLMDANERLDKLMMGMTSLNNESAVNLVGRDVVAHGDRFERSVGSPEELRFQLASEATDVTVTVFDENGRVVDAIDAGGRSAGESSVSWDGRDLSGMETDEGVYSFQVTARDANGDLVESSTFVAGRVEELRFVDGVPVLWVEGQNVGLESIIRVTGGAEEPLAVPEVPTSSTSSTEANPDPETTALEAQWALDQIAMEMNS